jgi:hypothetical protein
VPGWVLISLRVPARPDGPITFVIQEPTGWHPAPRSQLTLDPVTAEVVRWEPFAGQGLGRRLLSWVLHTGGAGTLSAPGSLAEKCQQTDTGRHPEAGSGGLLLFPFK